MARLLWYDIRKIIKLTQDLHGQTVLVKLVRLSN